MVVEKIKTSLKRIPLVYVANAKVKAWQTVRDSARVENRYQALARAQGVTYSEQGAIEQLRNRLQQRGLAIEPKPKGQLRILWVGADWNQDNSGFLAALQKFGSVNNFHKADGEYGIGYAHRPGGRERYDPRIVAANDASLLNQVQKARSEAGLDVLMGQMWAHRISVDALNKVQQMGVVTVNVAMDDRLPSQWGSHDGIRLGSIGLCHGLDLVLTSSPECCLRYAVEGCPALFWPMASDPERFKPYPEEQKQYDVSFIGNKYGLRGKVVDALQRAGVRVEAFGRGWPNGTATAEQSAEIFGKSRIILGVGNIAYNEDIFTLKLRDFDATMAGALYITHRNPDLLQLYEEGKEIECYLSIDECVEKVRYYLARPQQRMAIAMAGAARVRREHSWEHRLNKALAAVGFLAAMPSAATGGD